MPDFKDIPDLTDPGFLGGAGVNGGGEIHVGFGSDGEPGVVINSIRTGDDLRYAADSHGNLREVR